MMVETMKPVGEVDVLGGESIGKQTRSKGADDGWPATGERQGRDPSSRPALLGAEELFEYMEGVLRLRRGGRGRREGAGGGRGSVEERDANVAKLGRRPGGGRERDGVGVGFPFCMVVGEGALIKR